VDIMRGSPSSVPLAGAGESIGGRLIPTVRHPLALARYWAENLDIATTSMVVVALAMCQLSWAVLGFDLNSKSHMFITGIQTPATERTMLRKQRDSGVGFVTRKSHQALCLTMGETSGERDGQWTRVCFASMVAPQ
jgi:hypothetical protein